MSNGFNIYKKHLLKSSAIQTGEEHNQDEEQKQNEEMEIVMYKDQNEENGFEENTPKYTY